MTKYVVTTLVTKCKWRVFQAVGIINEAPKVCIPEGNPDAPDVPLSVGVKTNQKRLRLFLYLRQIGYMSCQFTPGLRRRWGIVHYISNTSTYA